jgi:hypothetical protein
MEEQGTSPKPQSVALAVKLLWASLGVGVVKAFLYQFKHAAAGSEAITYAVLAATLAIIAFLIFKIAAGRNWARIAFLVLFVLGSFPMAGVILGEFASAPFMGALSVAQIGLQAYALYLLFTQPGSAWFRKAAAA